MKRTPLAKVGKRAKSYRSRDDKARRDCKARAGGRCEYCGGAGGTLHHMIPCDDLEFRWHPANHVHLCWEPCHAMFDRPGGRFLLWAWFRRHRPEDFKVIGHRSREEA